MKINLFFATAFCRGSVCLGQTIEHKKYPSNGGESQRKTRDYTTSTFFYLKPKTSVWLPNSNTIICPLMMMMMMMMMMTTTTAKTTMTTTMMMQSRECGISVGRKSNSSSCRHATMNIYKQLQEVYIFIMTKHKSVFSENQI